MPGLGRHSKWLAILLPLPVVATLVTLVTFGLPQRAVPPPPLEAEGTPGPAGPEAIDPEDPCEQRGRRAEQFFRWLDTAVPEMRRAGMSDEKIHEIATVRAEELTGDAFCD